MNFRIRLTLMITFLLLGAVLVTAGAIAWHAQQTLHEESLEAGRRMAVLLTRSASFSNRVPDDVEHFIGRMMEGQAIIAAHYVDAAERAGDSPKTINTHLQTIADTTEIDEFWITDSQGKAYLHNLPFEFSFDPDPVKQPQAHIFWALISGEKRSVLQKAKRREHDGQIYKYVGAAGIDKPRIVQVGVNINLMEEIKQRIGLKPLVDVMVAPGDINAIWVMNDDLSTLAHAAILGTEVNPEPSAQEQARLREVLDSGEGRSFTTNGQMTVLAPIIQDGKTLGSVIVRLSTERQDAAMHSQIVMTAYIAMGVILFGILLAVYASGRITDPVMRVSDAARAMENGHFNPQSLASIADRNDELGRLAKVFVDMARTVIAREERLDAEVRTRTRELEQTNRDLTLAHSNAERALEQLKEAQNQLVESEKMAALGGLVAGVAHEINTPIGNSLTVATTLHRRSEAFASEVEGGTLRKSALLGFISDTTEATHQLNGNLSRAAELIQSFKQVALDRSSMERRQFQLGAYVRDLISSLQSVIKRHPVEIQLDIPDDIAIEGYPGAFGQIITNLTMNALTHAFSGRDRGLIEIQARIDKPEWIKLIYADDGMGIPDADKTHIFEPFFTTKRGSGGSGLGLHVTFNLVTQTLGGTLAVESVEGTGSRFILILPVVSPAVLSDPNDEV